jgi:hypothetical protein
MRRRKEVVFRECSLEPVGKTLLANLYHSVAVGTDQMVVVRLSAKPIAELSFVVSECVHNSFLAQQRERSVDSRETDRRSSPLAKALPECLRGHVIGLDNQFAKHFQSLARDLDIVPR